MYVCVCELVYLYLRTPVNILPCNESYILNRDFEMYINLKYIFLIQNTLHRNYLHMRVHPHTSSYIYGLYVFFLQILQYVTFFTMFFSS